MSALRKYRAAAICIILCKGAVKHARIAGSVSRWGELVNVLYLFAGFMKETETGAKSITVEWGFIDWSGVGGARSYRSD